VPDSSASYQLRVLDAPFAATQAPFAQAWDALLARCDTPNPFMRYAYQAALYLSGSATAQTGWTPVALTLWASGPQGEAMAAACLLWIKSHSYGEYVFDWAWANAYEQHRLPYYPKAVVAVPFTPVPGPRLLAVDASARRALAQAAVHWCEAQGLSSLHVLFSEDPDTAACAQASLMLRHTVQFHWTQPKAQRHADFDGFLASLNQDKRKKIRQERRKVAEAGVSFRHNRGSDISAGDWDFFYQCYERTYLEHGNAPYLSRDFFHRMAHTMPDHWLLFTAEREGRPIATSLIALNGTDTAVERDTTAENSAHGAERVAYGRYWGAMERVDCLHFEACYYQPLDWCIRHGYDRFEGGAQGEHKMARALLPVKTQSAHWLAHPAFADAVQRFLAREGEGVEHYLTDLAQRQPLKKTATPSQG